MLTQLKVWREKRGFSVRKLGALADVHYVTIVRMESGNLDPHLSTILRLCGVLGITVDQLLGMASAPRKGR
jgi:transcriptional regulator with XRE-family HTH domain